MAVGRRLNDTGRDRSSTGIGISHAEIHHGFEHQRCRSLPRDACAICQHAMRDGFGVERMKHGSGGKRGNAIEQNRHPLRARSQYRAGKRGDLASAQPPHRLKRIGKVTCMASKSFPNQLAFPRRRQQPQRAEHRQRRMLSRTAAVPGQHHQAARARQRLHAERHGCRATALIESRFAGEVLHRDVQSEVENLQTVIAGSTKLVDGSTSRPAAIDERLNALRIRRHTRRQGMCGGKYRDLWLQRTGPAPAPCSQPLRDLARLAGRPVTLGRFAVDGRGFGARVFIRAAQIGGQVSNIIKWKSGNHWRLVSAAGRLWCVTYAERRAKATPASLLSALRCPMSEATMNPIESPCILVCSIDEKTGYCFGCGRTSREIGAWLSMTGDERSAIMAELPARLETVERKPRRETRRARLAREKAEGAGS